MKPIIVEVHCPEYHIRSTPDYLRIGKKIDAAIESQFPDGKYIYRAISKDDHPHITLEDLINIIAELGTDKYDPEREEVCAESFHMYDHDIHAGCFQIKNHKIVLNDSWDHPSLFGDTAKKFFENTLLDRGYRVRIDLLIFYDADKLVRAKKTKLNSEGVRPSLEKYLYRFKEPNNKSDALIGILKILR